MAESFANRLLGHKHSIVDIQEFLLIQRNDASEAVVEVAAWANNAKK